MSMESQQDDAQARDREKSHADAYAAAADWHGRLDEDDSPRTHAEFDAWLAAHPRNKAAFEAVEQTWAALASAPVDARVLKMRREALSATHRLRFYRIAAAAAIVGIAVAIAYAVVPTFRSGSTSHPGMIMRAATEGGAFRTAVGERSNITLSDGSSVVLNTNSRVEVSYTPQRRSVRLLAGQAWFQVAKNPERPFVVEAGDQRVTALGTAFDVRMDRRDSVQVTLAEGKVSVEPILSPLARLISPPPVPKLLVAGEALIVSEDAPVEKRKADLTKLTWRKGQVVFDNDTLETAIAEINRYSATRIELADPILGQLRVSGVFKAGHSESFVETVTGHYPLQVASRDQSRILLTAGE